MYSLEGLDLSAELLAPLYVREQQLATEAILQVPPARRLNAAIRLDAARGPRRVKELITAVFEARTNPGSAVVTQATVKAVRLANGQEVSVKQILTEKGQLRRRKVGPPEALGSTIPDIGRFDADGRLTLGETKEPNVILSAQGYDMRKNRFRTRRTPGTGFQVKSSEVALQDAEREALRAFGLANPGSHWVMDVNELDNTPVRDLLVPSDKVNRVQIRSYRETRH